MTSAPSRIAMPLGDAFAVERELGGSATSRVFVARPRGADEPAVVVKAATAAADAVDRARFRREIALARLMRHPTLIPVLTTGALADGAHAGCPYYTMPYVRGGSLRERLDREGALPVGEALGIARRLAEGLQHVHACGVVHRDVKPENVLLAGTGPLLIDFGIACPAGDGSRGRITASGLLVGTPAYMSPEQAAGEAAVDGRTDVYALGCVLYEMLTGEPPFSGRSDVVLCRRLAEPAPSPRAVRPALPAAVDAAVTRALAPLPSVRHASAAAFADALRDAESTIRPPARVPTWRALLSF